MPTISTATGTLELVVCESNVQVRDAVYLKSADLYGRANGTSSATMPVAGFIVSKLSPTFALMRVSGDLLGFVGLTPAQEYVAAESPGQITATPSTAAGHIVQPVGRAKNSTTLTIQIYEHTVL